MSREDLLARSGHTLGLRDISLSIEEGSIYVIMGLSGSGKSTLIRHFNRLIEPTEGSVIYQGRDITKLPAAEMRAIGLRDVSVETVPVDGWRMRGRANWRRGSI